MGKPLSIDRRSRLVAVVAGGLSRRRAAERFGVSAASAVRWVQAVNTVGSAEAKPQGGDTRSHRVEAFSSVILAAVAAQKDISLVELADLLRTELPAHKGADVRQAIGACRAAIAVSGARQPRMSACGRY